MNVVELFRNHLSDLSLATEYLDSSEEEKDPDVAQAVRTSAEKIVEFFKTAHLDAKALSKWEIRDDIGTKLLKIIRCAKRLQGDMRKQLGCALKAILKNAPLLRILRECRAEEEQIGMGLCTGYVCALMDQKTPDPSQVSWKRARFYQKHLEVSYLVFGPCKDNLEAYLTENPDKASVIAKRLCGSDDPACLAQFQGEKRIVIQRAVDQLKNEEMPPPQPYWERVLYPKKVGHSFLWVKSKMVPVQQFESLAALYTVGSLNLNLKGDNPPGHSIYFSPKNLCFSDVNDRDPDTGIPRLRRANTVEALYEQCGQYFRDAYPEYNRVGLTEWEE